MEAAVRFRGRVVVGRRVVAVLVAWGFLSLLGACGLENPTFEPTTGSIQVVSSPDSASIVLDGSPTGLTTPATLDLLPRGGHVVRVMKPGYAAAPDSILATVEAGRTFQAEFSLVPTSGNLTVTSAPPGALVILDGRDSGEHTPAAFSGLTEGEHTVSVILTGYAADPESLVVSVSDQGMAAADFLLTPVGVLPAKTVLLEGFSNVCCPGCPEMNRTLQELMAGAGYGPAQVLLIKYAVGYPSPTDPHYLANVPDNDARAWGPGYDLTGYYADLMTSVPTLFGDGALLGASGAPPAASELAALVDDLLAEDPGFSVRVAAVVAGAAVDVEITLQPRRDLDLAGAVLNAVLLQNPVKYADPPCAGEEELTFHWIMRDFLTVADPLPNLTAGAPLVVTGTLAGNLLWPAADLYVAAFVQDDVTRRVLQAGSNVPVAERVSSPSSSSVRTPRSQPHMEGD